MSDKHLNFGTVKRIEPYPSGIRIYLTNNECIDIDIQMLGSIVWLWQRNNAVPLSEYYGTYKHWVDEGRLEINE